MAGLYRGGTGATTAVQIDDTVDAAAARAKTTTRSGWKIAALIAAATSAINAAWNAAILLFLPTFRPESYASAKPSGVLGDGTDDGPALAAMSAALNAAGGGRVDFYPGRTYWVGSQVLNGSTPNGTYTWAPVHSYPFDINACTKPVVVNMNGATIKCLPGKRYGSFNADGTARADTPPFYGVPGVTGNNISTPYLAMIRVKSCTKKVKITGGELDGNIAAQQIGGPWDAVGIQIPMTGYELKDNTGGVEIDLYTHHHGLDGGGGYGLGVRNVKEDVKIRGLHLSNGRNNFSLVGGHGWHFDGQFNKAGKDIGSMAYSAPGNGVDLEAEGGKYVINTTFGPNFEAVDNTGPAVQGYGALCYDADFYGGRLVGTTNWALWGERPGFRFHGTTFVGALINLHETTRFIGGKITDDPSLSPTGVVYSPGNILVGGGDKVCFEEVTWEYWSAAGTSQNGNTGDIATGVGMRHHNCSFVRQPGAGNFLVYGIFSGDRTNFTGGVDAFPGTTAEATSIFKLRAGPALDSFLYDGTRYKANADKATGKNIYYGSATFDPASLAAGAKTTIQTMTVTGVALGDAVEDMSFSLDLAGARLVAWVSAANTVSYYIINENGADPLNLGSGTVRVKVRQV